LGGLFYCGEDNDVGVSLKAMAELGNGFVDVATAVAEMKAGRMIVVVDDEDRENEGDLTLAAEFCTPEAINFMAKWGRGLICLTLTEARRCVAAGADDAGQYFAVWDGVYGVD